MLLGPAPAALNAAAASFAALTARLDYLSAEDTELVRRAYRFADEAHLGQLRNSGEPYITHLDRGRGQDTAAVAQGAWMRKPCMAALLHDAIEDCGVTKPELIERFGAPVAGTRRWRLASWTSLQFNTREAQNQAESFRKMLLAMARDVRGDHSSSWPTAPTTCARSTMHRARSGRALRARRWRSMRLSRIDWA